MWLVLISASSGMKEIEKTLSWLPTWFWRTFLQDAVGLVGGSLIEARAGGVLDKWCQMKVSTRYQVHLVWVGVLNIYPMDGWSQGWVLRGGSFKIKRPWKAEADDPASSGGFGGFASVNVAWSSSLHLRNLWSNLGNYCNLEFHQTHILFLFLFPFDMQR